MAGTRYSESRTLVRGLRRLGGQSRQEFKDKVVRLRRHFEQFNVNVAELCQWLMGLRPNGKRGCAGTVKFWEFFLEPESFLKDEHKEEGDKWRRIVFDIAAGLAANNSKSGVCFGPEIMDSASEVKKIDVTLTAARLFERVGALDVSSRQVLLKAAAEWVVAHYLRGYKNRQRHREEWEKEKAEWENNHPELTKTAREDLSRIFRELNVKLKPPRVCQWDRLKARKDDCEYAGERFHVGQGKWKAHSSLCGKYKEFFDSHCKGSRRIGGFKDHFVENLHDYVGLRKSSRDRAEAMDKFLNKNRQARWFPKAWQEYLETLGINEDTVVQGGVQHCVRFGADLDCTHNKHTNECEDYRRVLEGRPDLQRIEGLYRQWRREYLSPASHYFKYPSKHNLPTPKIFGKGFFRADFVNSVLELRMDGGAEGDFEQFGFTAWPKDYHPQPEEAEITSLDISFVGTRARAGFHFRVKHKKSLLAITQDDIDELRSRKYPRPAQDRQFLDEVRDRLVKSFGGNAEHELKVLAVDLGTAGGATALFEGKGFRKAEQMRTIKLDTLNDALSQRANRGKEKKSRGEQEREKKKGLGPKHVGRHLQALAQGASKIAKKRVTQKQKIADHDMRRLTLHIRWMLRDWVRLNASQIIETAERNKVDLIVFESMRGFRVPGYDKLDEDKKRRLAFFAHGQIRRKVAEKAVERGMRAVTVPYLKSSQVCADCGKEQQDKNKWQRNKWRGCFHCEQCGSQVNSDENAARVLGRVFWGEITLPEKLQEQA